MKERKKNTLKTHEETLSELMEMNRSPIDYSDISPMTEEERKTAQPYYKNFLDKLPPEMVKELIERRLADISVTVPEAVEK